MLLIKFTVLLLHIKNEAQRKENNQAEHKVYSVSVQTR